MEQERQQAERAGLKSRSAIKLRGAATTKTTLATRNPVLSRYNGIVRSTSTPDITQATYHNPRQVHRNVKVRNKLPSLPLPMTPSFLTSLPDPIPASAVEAQKLRILALQEEKKIQRAAAKKEAQRSKFAQRVNDTDEDEDSSGTDWDDSDEEMDLSRPYTSADRDLPQEKKYYGASGKNYLKESYASISQKKRIRKNMHVTDELHVRPATATRHFVDNCHRLNIPPEPIILRGFHGQESHALRKKLAKEKQKAKEEKDAQDEKETKEKLEKMGWVDEDGDGVVDQEELIKAMLVDEDGDGEVDTEEMMRAVMKAEEVKEMLDKKAKGPDEEEAGRIVDHKYTHHALNLTIQKNTSSLSLKHYGIGDVRAGAMSESLRILPGLKHLDLTGCRLGDAAAARAVNMLVAGLKVQHSSARVTSGRLKQQQQLSDPNDGLHSLNLSKNKLSTATTASLSKALRILPCLMVLKLSDCNLDDRVSAKLFRSLTLNHSCTQLDVSKNKLGANASKALGTLLTYNRVLTDLNLSWNKLGRGRDGINLVKSFRGSELRRVDLSMNVFGGSEKGTAVAMLGKVLPETNIAEMNLSCNQITALPACILMNGVSLHPPLHRMIINQNPIGKQGASAVLRALDLVSKDQHQGGSRLLDVDMYACACDNVPDDAASSLSSFDFLEPAGQYNLDLENPEDYTLACEILRLLNSRNGYGIKSASWAKPGSKSFKKLSLRRKDRKADSVSGPVSPFIDKKTGLLWNVPDSGSLSYEISVREHVPKSWNTISPVGFNQIHDLIEEQVNHLNRLALLDAACETFYFTAEQVRTLSKLFAGHERKHVMPKLMMRVLSTEDSAALMNDNRHLLTGQLALYEPHCCTGRYVLDLSNDNDRHLVTLLMRNSNDDREYAKRDKDNYFDLSQLGDESNFRNVKYEGEPFLVNGALDKNHSLPRKGYLTFDYVARSVQKTGCEPGPGPEDEHLVTEATFRKYLNQNTISCTQLLQVIQMLPKPKDWMTLDDKITALFCLLDEDDGGEVDKKEVMMAIIERPEVGDFMCQIPELEPLLEPRTFGPAFDAIDQDGGGSLDIDEFRQMCGVANDLAAIAQDMFDADSDGEWDEGEDEELRLRMKNLVKDKLNNVHKMLRQQMKDGNPAERFDAVYQLFHEMDEGHKDYLMPEEFANLTSSLGIILSAAELKDAVDTIDEDGNGQIEVDEYLDWWGDNELIDLYNARRDALESGKPYRMMSDKVAGESPAERLSNVREIFSECDVGDKDYLNPGEFQKLSETLGVKLLDAELASIIEEIDEDGNGQIEVDEYLDWWGDEELVELYEAQVEALESKKPYKLFAGKISKKANTRRKRLTSVNDLFDTNDIGSKEYLTPKEFDKLSKLLGVYLTPKELVEAVEEIDEDGNGQIEIDEYLAWWGDPELIELYEADEAGETIPSVEEEEANAEEVSSDEEDEDEEEDESGNADKKSGNNEDENGEASTYSSAYPNHQALEHTDFQRVDYIVAAHQRITDLHNFAYFWEFLSKGEVLATLHRLGWLNVFDPVSPDRRHYMDLDHREMQLVAKVLVRLAVVEPGENWLYENYMNKPGWELPVTWINTIPSEGRLTLTYSSTAKGCAPVWEERVKMRKYCLIPNDAPLPFESGGMASLKTSAAPITYPMFMRIMTTEESTIDCLGKAKEDALAIEEERRRRDEDEDSDDEEDEEDGEGNQPPPAALDAAPQTSPEGGENGVTGEADVASQPVVKARSKYRAPKSKGERNAYAFLETCKKHFLGMYDQSSDLEECLAQEWDSFCEQCEGRLGEDKNLAKAFKNLRAVFDTLEW